MPFITAHKILLEYLQYGFFGGTIYGPLRSGKSVFTIKVLGEVYAIVARNDWKEMITQPWEDWCHYADEIKPDWNAWKKWMPFLPEEYLTLIDEVQRQARQAPMFTWDDAGIWASSYRWADEFGKAVSEYANVQASDFAGGLYTTPDPRWLLKHLRDVPGGHTARVNKMSGNPYDYHRYIKFYEGWLLPDFKKGGVTPVYTEYFTCRLPDDVFHEYDAKRRTYTRIAADHIREVLDEIRRKRGEEAAQRMQMDMEVKTGIHVEGDGYVEIPVENYGSGKYILKKKDLIPPEPLI